MGRRWQGGTLLVTLVVTAVLCGAWAYADQPHPSITGVTITPDPAVYTDTLTAVPEGWSDLQGDTPGYKFQWAAWDVNHWDDIPLATEDHLHAGNFVRGDLIRVTCWPFDGVYTGQPQEDTITISDARPTVVITAPEDGSHYIGNPLLVEGTASDDGTVETVVLRFNGGLWLNVTGTTTWSRSINLPLGDNLIEARAKDELGKWGPIASITVTRDTQAPHCNILGPDDGFETSEHFVTVSGDAHDNSAVEVVRVRLNGAPWVNADLVADVDGWHWSRSIGVLQIGDNLIEARARDDAGVWGPIDQVTVEHVENVPNVVITSPEDGFVTSDTGITVTGTAVDIDDTVAVVRVRVNGVVWLNVTGTTIWSKFVALAPGVNVIEARARDTHGTWGPIEQISVTRTP